MNIQAFFKTFFLPLNGKFCFKGYISRYYFIPMFCKASANIGTNTTDTTSDDSDVACLRL